VDAASEASVIGLRVLVCAASLLLAACSAASAGEHIIAGKVTLGPMCGGPQLVGQSCDVDYADVEVRLLDGSGRQLASARTDAQGAFKFVTKESTVTVRVAAPKVVRCPDQVLHVPRDAATALTVSCDSGRR
jgi:type 1 fimbria pilin